MDIVEVLGVTASLITIALFVWGGWKRWTHRRQSEITPSANRRETLAEDIADELETLKRLVDTGWLGLIQYGEGWGDRADLIENYDLLQAAGVKLLGRVRRVEIAFGKDSRAALSVREATQAGEDAYYALQNIRRERADGAPLRAMLANRSAATATKTRTNCVRPATGWQRRRTNLQPPSTLPPS